MEQRKQQFFGFVIILLIIGILNYFRKIESGMRLTRNGKIIHIATMIAFVSGIMFVLYYTEINNIVSFLIGLGVANFSEHIAKLFITIGDNFNIMVAKIFKRYTGIDISENICNVKKNPKQLEEHKKDNESAGE